MYRHLPNHTARSYFNFLNPVILKIDYYDFFILNRFLKAYTLITRIDNAFPDFNDYSSFGSDIITSDSSVFGGSSYRNSTVLISGCYFRGTVESSALKVFVSRLQAMSRVKN